MIKKFCCYKITNTLNGKIYIGKTKADTSRRWKDHIRDSKIGSKLHLRFWRKKAPML